MTARLTEYWVELVNKDGKEIVTSVTIYTAFQTIKDAIGIVLDTFGSDTTITKIEKCRIFN